MAKDPAFLFYPSDFLTGTMTMTDQQVGVYIRLLCYQHQSGHIKKSVMQSLCDGIADAVERKEIEEKFQVDSDGRYFNERLENECIKRKAHSDKQRENAFKRWRSGGNANALPLESRNENEIEIKDKKKVREKFVRPTVDDVAAYMAEINYPGVVQSQAETFIDFYTGKGWKIGNSPMKDWKATVRTWKKRSNDNQPVSGNGKQQTAKTSKPLAQYTDAELLDAVAKRNGIARSGE